MTNRVTIMNAALVCKGRYTRQMFLPDGPLPQVEGTAVLVIIPGDQVDSNLILNALQLGRESARPPDHDDGSASESSPFASM
jgi:hypothetical protein